jgi:hypothetical protein
MPQSADDMVRDGINAYKSGDKDTARDLLLRAVDVDPHNEQGWLWLSGLLEAPEDQRICLENVLAINPANERARTGLDFLIKKMNPPAPAPPPPPAPPKAAAPVEWAVPTSSASAIYNDSDQPSSDDYDDWVTNLNLPTTTTTDPRTLLGEAEQIYKNTSPFTDVSLDDDSDPFGAAAIDLSVPSAPTYSPEPPSRTEPPSRRVPQPQVVDDEDEDEPRLKLDEATLRAIDEGANKFSEKSSDVRAALSPAKAEKVEEEFTEMFGIPKSIKATRLPGTKEGTPFLLVLAMLVLILLNLGAAALLVNRILLPM